MSTTGTVIAVGLKLKAFCCRRVLKQPFFYNIKPAVTLCGDGRFYYKSGRALHINTHIKELQDISIAGGEKRSHKLRKRSTIGLARC